MLSGVHYVNNQLGGRSAVGITILPPSKACCDIRIHYNLDMHARQCSGISVTNAK